MIQGKKPQNYSLYKTIQMDKKRELPLTSVAYNRLRNDILSCTLEPGENISLGYLADKYRIGRSPINNALQKLMHEGLVFSVPRVGYSVSPITVGDVKRLYEARLVLEVNINELAVKNSNYENLRNIFAMSNFRYIYKDPGSYSEFLEKNKEFHILIASATGNTRLLDFLTRILDELNRIFYLGLDIKDSAEEMQVEHRDLAVALINRDIEQVRELSRQQITRSQERVMDAISKNGFDQSNILLQDLIRLKRQEKATTI